MSDDELCQLLVLLLSRGSSRRVIRRVVARTWSDGGSLADATAVLHKTADVSLASRAEAEAELAAVVRLNLRVVRLGDPEYPPLLATIPDAPIVLFVRGHIAALARPMNIAIVGSRRASVPGRQFARVLAADLARAGFGVISGMAIGIDGAAHRGAIDVAGVTVAVVGGGHRNTYPVSHRTLAAEIASSGGAVIGEYPPSVRPRPSHFPERNRIISGLAAGVVVVEAKANSGSLITARMALEQGREVMAVPGPVFEGAYGGCHRLLREGAGLIEDAGDVLQTFGLTVPLMPRQQVPSEPEQARVFAAMPITVTTLDDLLYTLRMPVEEILQALVALELDGFVESCRGGYIRRPRPTGNLS